MTQPWAPGTKASGTDGEKWAPNITVGTESGGLKVWTGSEWRVCPVRVWSGSAWVGGNVKTWTGSTWKEL